MKFRDLVAVVALWAGAAYSQNIVTVQGVQADSLSANATISVLVSNNTASEVTNVPLTIFVTPQGGTEIVSLETIASIPATSTIVFTTPTVFDLSAGYEVLRAESTLVTDMDLTDNNFITVTAQPIPFFQDFEIRPAVTSYRADAVFSGFDGFSYLLEVTGDGRLSHRTDFDPDGMGIATMDNPDGRSTNRLILTWTGQQAVTVADGRELLLDFNWYDHDDESDATDIVELRGSPLDPWIEVYSFGANSNDGNWTDVTSINLSEFMRVNAQTLTDQAQIRFSQNDNFPVNTDGISVDDIRIAPKEDDVGIISVEIPGLDPYNPRVDETIRILLKNFTTVPLTNIPIQVRIDLPNGLPVFIDDVVPSVAAGVPLDPFQPDGAYTQGVGETTYDLLQTINPGFKFGEYTLSARSGLSGDPNPGNDTAVLMIDTAEVASLPVNEDFESVGPQLIYQNESFAPIGGIIGWSHVATLDERVQFARGNASSGVQAASLDAGNLDENQLVLTFDGLAIRPSRDKLFFETNYFNVGDEDNPEDGVFVRGKDTDAYQLLFDWNDGTFGTWRSTGPVDVSQVLRTASPAQDLSSLSQLKLQQHDDELLPNDGVDFDDVQLYQVPHRGLPVDQFEISASLSANGANAGVTLVNGAALGGEIDITAANLANITNVDLTGGRIVVTGQDATDSVSLVWDGPDGDFGTVDGDGLGGVDLTSGGLLDRLEIAFDGAVDFELNAFTDDSNVSSFSGAAVVIFPSLAGGITTVDFRDFTPTAGSGADFTNIGALTLTLTGSDTALAWVEVDSSRTATLEGVLLTDVDNDLVVSSGDILQYTARVGSGVGDLTSTLAAFDLGAGIDLDVGSVTAGQGTILTGNTAGDSRVEVALGTVFEGATTTITFQGTITAAPGAVTEVSTTGLLTTAEFTSSFDDPLDATSFSDPTVTSVILRDVSLTLTDAIAVDNGDGVAGGGDTIRYTAVLSNNGNTPELCGTLVSLGGAETTLVLGSVTSDFGMVLLGNRPGDTDVGVDLGQVDPGRTVTITWDANVTDPLGMGVTQTSAQVMLTATNLPTTVSDDPDTPAVGDATVTQLFVAPQLTQDTYTVDEDATLTVDAATGLLQNDVAVVGALTITAIDGQPAVGSDTAPMAGGTLNVAADGSFTYDPGSTFENLNAGQNAVVSFSYTAENSSTSATQTVEITVTGSTDSLAALPDDFSTLEDSGVVGNVLNDNGNGADAGDEGNEVITVTTVGTFAASGVGGQVTLSANGDFDFQPAADAVGVASFTYDITDGFITATGTVTITVQPVNDAPSFAAGPDVTIVDGQPLTQTLPAWATGISAGGPDEVSQNLTFQLNVQADPAGVIDSVAISNDGTLSFTLSGNQGSATVAAQLVDDGGTADGGQDSSMTQTFSVSFAPETIFLSGFEEL
ncbi:MAG: Ig-like domain-containing protein [Pseudomonadota bacterium]